MPSSIFPPYPVRWDASHWNNANVTYKSDHLPPNQRFHRYATHPSQQCKNIRPPKKTHPRSRAMHCRYDKLNQNTCQSQTPTFMWLIQMFFACFQVDAALSSTSFPFLIFPDVFCVVRCSWSWWNWDIIYACIRVPWWPFHHASLIFLVLLSSRFL